MKVGAFRRMGFMIAMLAAAVMPTAADEVGRWNRVATEVTAEELALDPLTESRVLAIAHVAMHDALNAVEPHYESYLPGLEQARDAAPDAAVAAAAHAALVELVPAGRSRFDAALGESLERVAEGRAKALGVALGRRAAERVLAARRGDGADASVPYRPGTAPGAYRPTPPDFTPAFQAHWGRIKPFALRSSDQFRPAPPPAAGSAAARDDIAEVKKIGSKESSTRTAEQSEIARFWYENSTQGWNRVAREIVAAKGLDSWDGARLFALVHLAMADGFIAGFEAKYHYNYWRPATAVRDDGDANWLPYLWTPPVPDYPSTHTVLGAAAATAIARALGTDFVAFSMTSGAPHPGITRRFWSLSEAARENGASRVLAGIHFHTAVRAGYEQGEKVGGWVVEHVLRPRQGGALAVSR